MYIDKENFEAWMERIMDKLDMQDKKIDRLLNRTAWTVKSCSTIRTCALCSK